MSGSDTKPSLLKKSEVLFHRGMRVGFHVESNVLIDVRAGKVTQYLTAVDKEIARLADAKKDGLVMAQLSDRRKTLGDDFAKAQTMVLERKSEFLEFVKNDAERLAEEAPGLVSSFLKLWDVLDDMRMKARYIVKLAKQQPRRPRLGGPDLSYLAKPALVLETALAELEAEKKTDCKAAFEKWSVQYEQVRVFVEKYRDEELAPPLAEAANAAAASDPAGPEAKMLSLFPKTLAKKMADMQMTAFATGADISMLHPAAGAAVAEYTTSAYSDINGTLLGLPSNPKRTPQQEADAKLLADIVEKSMAKLSDFETWPTKRGEKPWPGAAAQYKKGNVFETKAFWSTGVGFTFDGDIQITILGSKKKSRGKDVAPFSRFPNEKEVLFPPKTKFRVKSNTPKGENTIEVVVEEIG